MAVKVPSKVVQIGCGVVGHAYASAFTTAGHKVIGIEASRKRIDEIGTEYTMRHITDDLFDLCDVDFVLLSINTPLDKEKGALNMKYLWSSIPNVADLLTVSPDALVVVRSTVTIGFCAEYQRKLCKVLDRDHVPLCFQPEFLRAKSAYCDALSPWHVVIGTNCMDDVKRYVRFQQSFVEPSRISLCTIDEAEMMKIFHNSFNAAKISFFNQAGLLIEKIKSRTSKAIDAERTFKLIGRTCEGLLNPNYGLTPGHAYYGTCLPKDSAELAYLEKTYDMECELFAQVIKVNEVMRKNDKVEVLDGDNHIDNNEFLERSKPNKSLNLNGKQMSESALAQTENDEAGSPNSVKNGIANGIWECSVPTCAASSE